MHKATRWKDNKKSTIERPALSLREKEQKENSYNLGTVIALYMVKEKSSQAKKFKHVLMPFPTVFKSWEKTENRKSRGIRSFEKWKENLNREWWGFKKKIRHYLLAFMRNTRIQGYRSTKTLKTKVYLRAIVISFACFLNFFDLHACFYTEILLIFYFVFTIVI